MTPPAPLAPDWPAWPGVHRCPRPSATGCWPRSRSAQPGGTVRISDSTTFPRPTTISAAFAEVEPGGGYELHSAPHANKAQYYIVVQRG